MIKKVVPVIDYSVRGLCLRPYEGHPKGCPNFNKRTNCPPKEKRFSDLVDTQMDVYFIWNEFDFATHCNKMRTSHPEWSDRQVQCCLYWQGTARKSLKSLIAGFYRDHPQYSVTWCPEAMGVNMTESMKNLGVELEWPPKNKTYQIAMAFVPRSPDV